MSRPCYLPIMILLLAVVEGCSDEGDSRRIGVDEPPVALDDLASTLEDAPVVVDVLANDEDPEAAELTVVHVTQPSHGSAEITESGITYAPETDFFGDDSFTYTIADEAGLIATANVAVGVSTVNDLPSSSVDFALTYEDASVELDVLQNDDDIDEDAIPLTVESVSEPAHGSATIVAGGTRVLYEPDPQWNGVDTFSYTAFDGVASAVSASVSVSVLAAEDSPVGAADAKTVAEDGFLDVAAPGVLGNDDDPDGDALQAALVSLPAHGTLAFESIGAFTYAPALDFSGADAFAYEISDGHGASIGPVSVSITITPVNDAPVAFDDAYVAVTGSQLVVASELGLLANDTDVDSAALAFGAVTAAPLHGTVVVNAAGGFTYTPDGGYTGPDTFAYSVTDGALFDMGDVLIDVSSNNVVRVTDVYGTPLGGELVVVNDRDGEVVSTGVTASDGNLSVTIPSGGSCSVLTTAPNGTREARTVFSPPPDLTVPFAVPAPTPVPAVQTVNLNISGFSVGADVIRVWGSCYALPDTTPGTETYTVEQCSPAQGGWIFMAQGYRDDGTPVCRGSAGVSPVHNGTSNLNLPCDDSAAPFGTAGVGHGNLPWEADATVGIEWVVDAAGNYRVPFLPPTALARSASQRMHTIHDYRVGSLRWRPTVSVRAYHADGTSSRLDEEWQLDSLSPGFHQLSVTGHALVSVGWLEEESISGRTTLDWSLGAGSPGVAGEFLTTWDGGSHQVIFPASMATELTIPSFPPEAEEWAVAVSSSNLAWSVTYHTIDVTPSYSTFLTTNLDTLTTFHRFRSTGSVP